MKRMYDINERVNVSVSMVDDLDSAFKIAREKVIRMFGIDINGNTNNVYGASRASHSVKIEFSKAILSISMIGDMKTYKFEAWVECV